MTKELEQERGKECEGGVCVEIRAWLHSGPRERINLDIHITGNDQIRFGWATRVLFDSPPERIEFGTALRVLHERLIERGIIA